MGPYTCTAENCGRHTLNDSHLCDDHDPDQQPEEEMCCLCDNVAFGYADGFPFCVPCYQRLPSIANVGSPPPSPEDDEPDDPDATPIIEGDDPDDYITDPPGGES